MSKRSSNLLIEDILEALEKIIRYTRSFSFDKFISNDKTVDAVIRNFEIIGEASNKLSSEAKKNFPNIDWKRIRGFRNRIVHHYFGIDHSIVWNIIQNFLPELLKQLKTESSEKKKDHG